MSKEQAQEAIIQISNIVDQWTDMNLDANDALELMLPLLQTLISYFQKEETPAAESKRSMYEDLEKDLDKENGDPPLYEPEVEVEQEDLFKKKEEDLKKEEDSD